MGKNEIIKQYLLNNLSETDRVLFERRYFEDDDLYRRLLVIEEELITDYVYDRLEASARRLFNEHYSATPERRRRIEIAMKWKRVISYPRRRAAAEPISCLSATVLSRPFRIRRSRRKKSGSP